RSTSPPMRIRCRRSSSSCSEKCSFTISLPLTPEGLGRNHLQVSLMGLLFTLRGDRAEHRFAVEHSLEQIGLAPRRIELRLAIAPRRDVELHAPRSNAAAHFRDQLAMAAV